MRLSTTRTVLPALIATLAALAFAGQAFARGSCDRQVVKAAGAKGLHHASQARPGGDVVDGDVVDGRRLRLIGARSAVPKARERLKRSERRELGRHSGVT